MNERTAVPEEDTEQYRATLQRLERFASLMDSRFRIPGTDIRFGLGPVIGFVPVVGDFAGLALSGYVILESRRINAPGSLQLRMLGNGILDAVGGTLPVLGDVFDVWYRANDRNVALLRSHLEEKLQEPEPRRPNLLWWLIGVGAVLVVGGLVYNLTAS